MKFIKITRPLTRWFLDKYSLIINPYGSVYPEDDVQNLTVMKSVLHYVDHGGIFVNVADIPFFYPYDPRREIMYGAFAQEAHLYKYIVWNLHLLKHKQDAAIEVITPYPYVDTPFLRAVKINIVATEIREFDVKTKRTEIFPMLTSLKMKDSNFTLEGVAVHRGIVLDSHVKSIVEELEWEREYEKIQFTPLCDIYFGKKGKFIISSIFLEYVNDEIAEKIVDILCEQIIKEIRHS